MDHHNLDYLRMAKRLKARQARWALFLSRFCFTITYHPGSKNRKADALSNLRLGERDDVTILPPSVMVALVFWHLEGDLQSALSHGPAPASCPATITYVPTSIRIITWAHTSPATDHSGITHTTQLLTCKYWWPTLASDVRKYIMSCSLCAITKSPCMPPSVKLLPLPVLEHPWWTLSLTYRFLRGTLLFWWWWTDFPMPTISSHSPPYPLPSRLRSPLSLPEDTLLDRNLGMASFFQIAGHHG